ncbi:ComEC/Rec2 family competence protein [Escherichia coli]
MHWQIPLIGGICWCRFLCLVDGNATPALRTVVALATWGMLKLSGRQWSGWDVWICCLAAILLMDPVAILSQSLWLSAAAVAALIFWYQWFPCPEWHARRIACSCFPHPSATGYHTSAYARANRHISWH